MTVELTVPPLTETGEEDLATEWEQYLRDLTAAVAAADPGTAYDWETRERIRVSTWVRHVYEHPRSTTLFARPEPGIAADARRRETTALAGRLDVGRTVARPLRPGCEVWAAAAVAATWELTAAAVIHTERPGRERLVSDVWTVVRTMLLPAVDRFTPVVHKSRRSW